MLPSRRQPVGWAAVMAVVLLWASLTAAQGLISVDYCSTINTATTPGNHSDFQSQGLCTGFCKQKRFGLAIVKENNCWCSSILPSESIQVPTSRCRNSCPGFPPDVCGGDKTFGYMRINSNPITATAAGGSQDQTTAANPGTTGKPTPSVETVTVDGTVKTVTAPAAPDGSDSSSAQSNTKQEPGGNGGALGAGAIAGIVIGVLAIFAIGAIAGFLVMRRKKRKEEEAYEGPTSPRGSGAAMAHVPRSPDGGDGFGSRPGGRRPTNGTYGSDHSSGRRSSMLMPSDPRMNPTPGIYGRADLNKSHDSFLTIQDNRDYSRPVHEPAKVLKVTNASPDDMD